MAELRLKQVVKLCQKRYTYDFENSSGRRVIRRRRALLHEVGMLVLNHELDVLERQGFQGANLAARRSGVIKAR